MSSFSPSRPFILRPVATSLLMVAIFACGRGCVFAIAGVAPAAGGLPDDPGDDVLSGCEPGGDGVFGDFAAGAAVRTDSRAEPDDIDEFGRRQRDYAAVFADGVDRYRAAGRAGGNQRSHELSAEGPSQSARL